MKRTALIIIGAIVLIVGIGVAWYLVSPLFIDNTVDEAFPVQLPSEAEAGEMSGDELEVALVTAISEAETLDEEEMAEVEAQVQKLAAMMPDKPMDEEMPEPEAAPTVVAQGEFVDADDFHKGSGDATVYTVAEGGSVLRFEDFDVTNGPDLHVILSTNPNPTSRDDIGDDYIDLGSLKGNMGNQNYEIPSDVDLSAYQSVVIYCMPFHVVFSTATLSS
jgi:hypothetical protein